jgi:hypothetical protein
MTGRLDRIKGKMKGAKYKEILDKKNCSRALRTSDWGKGSPFQQDNDPKHTAKTTQEWLQVFECP